MSDKQNLQTNNEGIVMNLSRQTLDRLIGTTAQILPEAQSKAVYQAKFLGYANEESLMLSVPTEGNTPMLANIGDGFIVRFNDGEKQLAFHTNVNAVCEKPFGYLHLSFPTGEKGTMMRRGQRYNLPKTLNPAFHLVMSDGNHRTKIEMSDISQSGACLTAVKQLGNIDENFSIDIIVENRQITLPCKVRYVRKELHEQTNTEFMHGVEFQELNIDAQLFVDQFIQKHVRQQRHIH